MKPIALFFLLLATTASHAQIDAIRTLTPTNNQAILHPIEAQIFSKTKAELPLLEKKLLKIFVASDTTLAGKQYACRMLRHCASETCVPMLAPKLTDPDLSSFVRLVFQGLETPAVDKALIKALPKANPEIKVGLIGTLGQRGSKNSVAAIATYLKSSNTEIQLAAITALGNIGGKNAAKALINANVAPALSNENIRAQLNCAETLNNKNAAKIYMKYRLYDNEQIQASSLIGLSKIAPDGFSKEVLKILDSHNPKHRNTAIGLLASLPTEELLKGIENLSPENQILIITTLSDRKATKAESAILQLAASKDETVRNAAILALGNVGTIASIQPLLAVTTTNAPAFNALCALNAEGVDAAIIQVLKTSPDEPTTIKRLECLALRQTHAALPIVIKIIEDSWSRQAQTAVNTVAAIAHIEDFPLLTQLMLSAQEPGKLQALEKTIAKAALRQTDLDPCALPLVDAIERAKPESQYALLRTLGRMGGKVARKQLTHSLESSDPHTKDAAIRGLCSWPNIAVADQLLEQAQTADIQTHRILALRGYIRLAGGVNDFSVVSNMCYTAATAVEQPAELKGIIGCIKRFKKQETLDFLAPYLDNPSVFNEAAWAICEISTRRILQQFSLPLLEKISTTATEERLVVEVKKRIEACQPDPQPH